MLNKPNSEFIYLFRKILIMISHAILNLTTSYWYYRMFVGDYIQNVMLEKLDLIVKQSVRIHAMESNTYQNVIAIQAGMVISALIRYFWKDVVS